MGFDSVDGDIVNHGIRMLIELDDGEILTGKPKQFDGKNIWFPVSRFSQTNQSIEMGYFHGIFSWYTNVSYEWHMNGICME